MREHSQAQEARSQGFGFPYCPGPLRVIAVPCLQDNFAYLLVDEEARVDDQGSPRSGRRAAVVVDPSEGGPVQAVLRREGLCLEEIWLTHHHHDHVGGVVELLSGLGCSGDEHASPPPSVLLASRYDVARGRIPGVDGGRVARLRRRLGFEVAASRGQPGAGREDSSAPTGEGTDAEARLEEAACSGPERRDGERSQIRAAQAEATPKVIAVEDGMKHRWRGHEMVALHLPGHTLGAVAFLVEGECFTGDTLFVAGCGRLFEGTGPQLAHALSRLGSLPSSTRLWPGHEYAEANLTFAFSVEPSNSDTMEMGRVVRSMRSQGHHAIPSTVAQERSINPFLRSALGLAQLPPVADLRRMKERRR